jgi:hypothetical protein
MKVLMEIETSIAANTTTENVLTGQRFERAPFEGFLTLLSTGSATGLREELNVGGQSISGRLVVNTQNRSPVVPDDLRIADVRVSEGKLIQLTVTNTTAGALTYRARVELEEGVRL